MSETTAVDYSSVGSGAALLRELGIDARKWASAFLQLSVSDDVETVQGWFANAIMAGYDEGRKQVSRPPYPHSSEGDYEEHLLNAHSLPADECDPWDETPWTRFMPPAQGNQYKPGAGQ